MRRFIQDIDELLAAFSLLIGGNVVWKDKNGAKGVVGLADKHFYHCNSFCEQVKKLPGGFKQCAEGVLSIASDNEKGAFSSFCHCCHAGCAQLIVPILVDDECDGMLFVGPFKTAAGRPSYSMLTREYHKLELLDGNRIQAIDCVIKSLVPQLKWLKRKHEELLLKGAINHPKIVHAIDFIRKNVSKPLTADIVASEVGLSISRFLHLFKEETGKCFSSHITSCRIELAKRLLTETNMRIYEVAMACGYSEQCYFGMVFKKQTGIPPNQYRKRFGLKNTV